MDFEGKVIILTGASSGIGEACAYKFAKSGALLSLIGRKVENLNRVAERCTQYCGNRPLIISADISIAENIDEIVQSTVSHYGKIDVLVNNAGILILGGIMDDVANLDKMIATNVRGTYLLTQKCIPHLIESKGNIVTISSVVSTVAVPAMLPYSMTKAALDIFTQCIALELGPKGVRVNSVNPGPVFSNLFVNSGMSVEFYKEKFEEVKQSVPLGKITEPEDVAELVTFLTSDKAKSISGSIHYIDGGLHLGVPPLKG